ncbi:MAG: Tim44/TimA family putative adaptor protein [Micropepsaceae bacterium]
MGGSEIEILFFAGIAAFIGYRLYMVLGKRTGNEQPPFDRINQRERMERPRASAAPAEEKVVPLSRGRETLRPLAKDSIFNSIEPGSKLAASLKSIREQDPGFDADAFVKGAKGAHEMIAKAFADADRDGLKPLLADDVFASFEGAISVRERSGQKMEFAFVGLKEAKIEVATLRGRIAEITVRFVSELISATRDAAGVVIEGAAGVVREVTDVWTFARDTKSSDPNWKVVATAGAA